MFHRHELSGPFIIQTILSIELKCIEILERVSSVLERYAVSIGEVAGVLKVHSTSTFSVHQSKHTP
jgi:hypothetical protein